MCSSLGPAMGYVVGGIMLSYYVDIDQIDASKYGLLFFSNCLLNPLFRMYKNQKSNLHQITCLMNEMVKKILKTPSR